MAGWARWGVATPLYFGGGSSPPLILREFIIFNCSHIRKGYFYRGVGVPTH